jgi:hypothetical protein
MANLIIYVLQLENDKWFLHVSTPLNEYVLLECETLFEFVKKNKPIRIFETLNLRDKYEINSHVKRYMEYIGIDNVRGGIYSDEILPEYVINNLRLEISSSIDTYEKKVAIFNNIRRKKDLTIVDFNNKMNEYTNLINKGYNEFNRDFFTDLEWFTDIIKNAEKDDITYKPRGLNKINSYDNARYKSLLKKLDSVYNFYFNLDEDTIKVEPSVILQKPLFIFDRIFYHPYNIKDCAGEIDIALNLIRKYEFMGYTLINIIDGLEFDLYN